VCAVCERASKQASEAQLRVRHKTGEIADRPTHCSSIGSDCAPLRRNTNTQAALKFMRFHNCHTPAGFIRNLAKQSAQRRRTTSSRAISTHESLESTDLPRRSSRIASSAEMAPALASSPPPPPPSPPPPLTLAARLAAPGATAEDALPDLTRASLSALLRASLSALLRANAIAPISTIDGAVRVSGSTAALALPAAASTGVNVCLSLDSPLRPPTPESCGVGVAVVPPRESSNVGVTVDPLDSSRREDNESNSLYLYTHCIAR
jgi:hypothetical protein